MAATDVKAKAVRSSKLVYVFGFLLVLLLSLIVHIPANWVLQQPLVKDSLQQSNIQLTQAQGTIWSGSANITLSSNRQSNLQSIGRLEWQLEPFNLLLLKLAYQTHWQLKESQLHAMLEVPLLASDELHASHIHGELSIENLMPVVSGILSTSMQMVSGAQGQLSVLPSRAVLNMQQAMPLEVEGKATLSNFNFMENRLPAVEITLKQAMGETAKLAMLGSADSWNLQGEFTSDNWQQFSGEIHVKAQSAQAIPDWAFALRKKTPTHYIARF